MPYKDTAARIAYDKQYQAEHRERRRAKSRAWHAAHRERALDQSRAYSKAHREEAVARGRAFHAEHRQRQNAMRRERAAADREEVNARRREQYRQDPERLRRRVEAYRHENPTRVAATQAAKAANRKARVLGVRGYLTGADVIALWQRQPVCVDCGDGRGLDHAYPLSLGGSNTTGNLANRCRSCNSRKGRRLPEEVAA